MTVQELIEQLNKIDNKRLPVIIHVYNHKFTTDGAFGQVDNVAEFENRATNELEVWIEGRREC